MDYNKKAKEILGTSKPRYNYGSLKWVRRRKHLIKPLMGG